MSASILSPESHTTSLEERREAPKKSALSLESLPGEIIALIGTHMDDKTLTTMCQVRSTFYCTYLPKIRLRGSIRVINDLFPKDSRRSPKLAKARLLANRIFDDELYSPGSSQEWLTPLFIATSRLQLCRQNAALTTIHSIWKQRASKCKSGNEVFQKLIQNVHEHCLVSIHNKLCLARLSDVPQKSEEVDCVPKTFYKLASPEVLQKMIEPHPNLAKHLYISTSTNLEQDELVVLNHRGHYLGQRSVSWFGVVIKKVCDNGECKYKVVLKFKKDSSGVSSSSGFVATLPPSAVARIKVDSNSRSNITDLLRVSCSFDAFPVFD